MRLEGVLQGRKFVEKHAQRPDVRSPVVLLVPPHLRRHVVRSTDLCLSHTILGALSHAQVAYFDAARARDEDVWRLDVAVQNFGSVKLLEALADLDEKGPDQAL